MVLAFIMEKGMNRRFRASLLDGTTGMSSLMSKRCHC